MFAWTEYPSPTMWPASAMVRLPYAPQLSLVIDHGYLTYLAAFICFEKFIQNLLGRAVGTHANQSFWTVTYFHHRLGGNGTHAWFRPGLP
jgi:hypothetical protein